MPGKLKKATNVADPKRSAIFMGRALAEDTAHPLQKRIKFVFTDFQPNANNQGVPESEAQNVINTSLYMPVKINFDGNGPVGHSNAMNIGPITHMYLQDSQIIGDGIIWTEGNEEIVEWLMTASAEEGGAQFSWEMYFDYAETDTNGTDWLRGIVSDGICIVDNPAYEGRTPLLSIAEKQDAEKQKKEGDMDKQNADASVDGAKVEKAESMDELYAQVKSLTDRMYQMMEALYSALDEVQPQVDSTNIEDDFNTMLDKLRSMCEKARTTSSEIESLRQELSELKSFKEATESANQRATTLATRRATLVTSGIILSDEAFDKRADTIASMTGDQFDSYVADLVDLLASKTQQSQKQTSSVTKSIVPDPFHSGTQNDTLTIKDLAQALKTRKRTSKTIIDVLN